MSDQEKIPVWLDCDPGHDDAFAILLAAYLPSTRLLGLSTVHGNSSLQHTTRNALSVITAIGRPDIPVYPGACASLNRPAVHAPAIHGVSGIDGTSLLPNPLSTPKDDEPAVEAMARCLLSTAPQTAWLVATGALTNIALLFSSYPEVASHIKGLSIMGGAIGDNFTSASMGHVPGDTVERIGNWSRWAEFNILVDPEAADQIFRNPILNKKTTLIPIDVTHQVLATKDIQKLVLWGKEGAESAKEGLDGKGKSILRRMLLELLIFFAKTYQESFGFTIGPPLHDPLAVAAILDGIPGVEIPFRDFAGEQGRRERYEVHVVTKGTHDDAQNGAETGRTIVKLLPEGVEGVKIPRGLNIPHFWEVVEDCLARADEENKRNDMS